MTDGKKAIIFGVSGQDGSYLAEFLLGEGFTVVGVTRRVSTDNTQRIQHLFENKRFVLESGDITDAHSVFNILKKHEDTDHIYNLAAQSHVAVSFKQPGLTWDITGKGCLNILQTIVDLGLLHVRFYQASSSEMFGASYDIDPDTDVKYQNENTKFLPQSPYAIAKCAAHYMTRLYREGYGVHASAGILFNHESSRRGDMFVTKKITKWIGEFKRWLGSEDRVACDDDMIYKSNGTFIEDEFPKLRLGNLEACRDWGHAKDYVRAMYMMLNKDYPDDYVICTGETHSVREFLDIAFREVGIEVWSPYVVIDPEFYRPAEVDYLRGDNSKAKNVLGWEPEYSFEHLVSEMVEHDLEYAFGK